MINFHDAFSADYVNGRLFWAKPPKNHAELTGVEAGYVNRAKGKNKDYWHIRLGGKTFKRSRVMFYMYHGYWPMPCVDHINGNSLDDSITNLRQSSFSQNTINSKPKRSQFGFPRGVSRTVQGKYMARINMVSLGVYDTPELASSVYESKRTEVFGEYA